MAFQLIRPVLYARSKAAAAAVLASLTFASAAGAIAQERFKSPEDAVVALKGREQILNRRMDRNELNAIQVGLAYVDAQNDYAEANPQRSPVPGYAQRVASSPNKKDGLYWPTGANEPRSPLGEAMALATLEGDRLEREPRPYHGYYYRILTRQGPSAPGGAASYIVDGNMIGGFALVAHPAEYGSSGVMTFLVNHEGTVFQKDLGAETGALASRMTSFDPDHTWKKVGAPDLAYDPR